MTRSRLAVTAFRLGIVNLVIALGFATMVRLKYLVWSVDKSDPPLCYNHDGNSVSCRLEHVTTTIFVATTVGLFVLLAGVELLVYLRRTSRDEP